MPDLGNGLDHAIALRRTDLHRLLLEAVNAVVSVAETLRVHRAERRPGRGGDDHFRPRGRPAPQVRPPCRPTSSWALTASTPSSAARAASTVGCRPEAPTSAPSCRVGPTRGSRSTGHRWDPSATPRWAATPSTSGLPPTWAPRPKQSPAATFSPSGRSGEESCPSQPTCWTKVPSFDDLLVNTVRRVDCRRWFSGRLVLLGDSAHAMAPNLGQGANSALVDALILADRNSLRLPRSPRLLARYDQHRRPTARRLQNIAGILQRLCCLRPATAVQIRDALCVGLAGPQVTEKSIRRALAPDVQAARAASVRGATCS